MKNVSLVNITVGVALIAIATFIVNANEIAPTVTEAQEAVTVEGPSALPTLDFSVLLSEFDVDKNGLLSETELSESGNEMLKSAFKVLDVDEDENLSAGEFEKFEALLLD